MEELKVIISLVKDLGTDAKIGLIAYLIKDYLGTLTFSLCLFSIAYLAYKIGLMAMRQFSFLGRIEKSINYTFSTVSDEKFLDYCRRHRTDIVKEI